MSISDPDNIDVGTPEPDDNNKTPMITRKTEPVRPDRSQQEQSARDAFETAAADFERACEHDKLLGLDLVETRAAWAHWTDLAAHAPLTDVAFDQSLSDFRDAHPQAAHVAILAQRLWDTAEVSVELLTHKAAMDSAHLLNAHNPHLAIPPHEDTSRMA